ncbi:MAG: RHS repeat-associated core domain-containing protein [Candidatus Promineifilaceae bacterium]
MLCRLALDKRHWLSVYIIFSMLLQITLPIFDPGPGYLRPNLAAAQEEEEGDDANSEDFLNDSDAAITPLFEFPEKADTLAALMPSDAPRLPVQSSRSAEGEHSLTIATSGGAALLDDNMLIVVEADSFEDTVTLQTGAPVSPTFKSEPSSSKLYLPLVFEHMDNTGTAHQKPVEGQTAAVADTADATEAVVDSTEPSQSADTDLNDDRTGETEDDFPEPPEVEVIEPIDPETEPALPEEGETESAGTEPEEVVPSEPTLNEDVTEIPVETPSGVVSASYESGELITILPPVASPTDTMQQAIETQSAEMVFEFSFAVTAQSGETITHTNRPINIALDVREWMEITKDDLNVWFVSLHPVNDPAAVVIPLVKTYDDLGLISFTVNDLTAGQYNVSVGTVGSVEEKSAERSTTRSNSPESARPQFAPPTISEFSGAATYQHAIPLPAGRGGLTPNVDVSYSSAALRGMTSNNNEPQGGFGLGWSMNGIAIVRTASTRAHDRRYHGDQYSLQINGGNHNLLYMGQNGGVLEFKAQGDPTVRVTMHYMASAPSQDGIFWVVQTGNGTVYRLGYTHDSESTHWMWDDDIIFYHDNGTPVWHGKDRRISAYRWDVDTVTDLQGNQAQYNYQKYHRSVDGEHTLYTIPLEIKYNFAALQTNHNPQVASFRLEEGFGTVVRFESNDFYYNERGRQRLEHPYKLVTDVRVYHLDLAGINSPSKGKPIHRVNFNYDIWMRSNMDGNNCYNSNTWDEHYSLASVSIRLNWIRTYGYNNTAMPPTQLEYGTKGHGDHFLPHHQGKRRACYQFQYLTGVRAPAGGHTTFVYQHDGRFKRDGRTDAGDHAIANSWFVQRVETVDGVTGWRKHSQRPASGQVAKTTYHYNAPCYNYVDPNRLSLGAGMSGFICQSKKQYIPQDDKGRPFYEFKYGSGSLVGFGSVRKIARDYDGTILNQTVSTFYRGGYEENGPLDGYGGTYGGLLFRGKQRMSRVLDSDGKVIQETWNSYKTLGDRRDAYVTVPTTQCTYIFPDKAHNYRTANRHCKTTKYKAEASPSSDLHPKQFGLPLEMVEAGNIGGKWRTVKTEYWYEHNLSKWIVGKQVYQAIYDDGNLMGETRTKYDMDRGLMLSTATRQQTSGTLSEQFVTMGINQYDDYGNVTKTFDAKGQPSEVIFDSAYNLYPVKTINAKGHTEELYYVGLNSGVEHNQHLAPGMLREKRGADNVWQIYWYDQRGRLKSVRTGAERNYPASNSPDVRYAYDDPIDWNRDGRIDRYATLTTWTKIKDNATVWSLQGARQLEFYDGLGRVIQTHQADSDWRPLGGQKQTGHLLITDMVYDAAGNVVAQTVPYRQPAKHSFAGRNWYEEPSQSVAKTYTTYDTLGQAVSVSDPNGLVGETVTGKRAIWAQSPRDPLAGATQSARDDFEGGIDSQWNQVGNISSQNGLARLQANNANWGTYINYEIPENGHDTGASIRFKPGVGAAGVLMMHSGSWGSDYFRWGVIFAEDGSMRTNIYQDGSRRDDRALFRYTPGKWYRLVLRASHSSDKDWVMEVWEEGNPDKRSEFSLSLPASFDNRDYKFQVNVRKNVTKVDTFAALQFENEAAPQTLKASFVDSRGQLIKIDETDILAHDNFDSGQIATDWTTRYQVSTGGTLKLKGHPGWAYATRDLSTSTFDTGVAMRFKASDKAYGVISLDNAAWGNGYHSWRLVFKNNTALVDVYENDRRRSDLRTTLLTLQPDSWYNLIMRMSDKKDEGYSIVIWENGNPENRAEYRVRLPNSKNAFDTIRFIPHVNRGTLEIDDYREFEFYRTQYQHDAIGNLTHVTNPLGQTTTMTYNMLGQKVAMNDPNMGDWVYRYDVNGNLIWQEDALDQQMEFAYDELNRLTSKWLYQPNTAATTMIASYEYDGAMEDVSATGKRVAMTAYDAIGMPHNSATWSYDSMGRVASETRDIMALASLVPIEEERQSEFAFTYTQGGMPLSITYPDKEVVTTEYDGLTGQATGLFNNFGQQFVLDTTYNAMGQVVALNYGNNVRLDYVYDVGGRLQAQQVNKAYLPSFAYQYDANGNIIQIEESHNDLRGGFQRQTFAYDGLNRLVDAETTAGSSEFGYSQQVSYDPLGNIVERTNRKAAGARGWSDAEVMAYGYGQNSGIRTNGDNSHIHGVTHINNEERYEYDANGNMTMRIHEHSDRNIGREEWTLRWTPENMLAEAGTDKVQVNFSYDADGQMILREEGPYKTVNLSDGLFEWKYDDLTRSASKQYHFNGQVIAQKTGEGMGDIFFNLNDHLGGLVAQMAATSALAAYSIVMRDPWGKRRGKKGNMEQLASSHLFTNQRWDERLELYDYNARYYDGAIGRFISADSVIPNEANPQAFNRFAYVYNSPIQLTDPSGHTPDDDGDLYEGANNDSRLKETQDHADTFAEDLADALVSQMEEAYENGDARTLWTRYTALIAGARAKGYTLAAKMMTKFLYGNGDDVFIDPADILQDNNARSAYETLHEAMVDSAIQDAIANGPGDYTFEGIQLVRAESNDLWYAMGSFHIHSTAQISVTEGANGELIVDVRTSYTIEDGYNWHGGLDAGGGEAGISTIRDEWAMYLVEEGFAREFVMHSSWTDRTRIVIEDGTATITTWGHYL